MCGPPLTGVALDLDGQPVAALGGDSFGIATGTQRAANEGPIWQSASARSAAIGTITGVDVARGELRVGAQRVRGFGAWLAAPGKFVGFALTRLSIAELAPGDRVRVLGYPAGDGTLVAFGVRRAAATDADRLAGFASAVDAVARRLTIGATRVDYGAAQLRGLAGPDVPNDSPVLAIGRIAADGTLVASELVRRTAPDWTPGTVVSLAGTLARFGPTPAAAADPVDVEIGGQPVRIARRCFDAGLTSSRYVRASGVVRGDGVIDFGGAAATEPCTVEPAAPAGGDLVSADVEAVDVDAGTLSAFGATFVLQPETLVTNRAGLSIGVGSLVGRRVQLQVWPGALPGRAFAAAIAAADGSTVPSGSADVDTMTTAAGPSAVWFLQRPVALDAGTVAQLTNCSGTARTTVSAAEFIEKVFGWFDFRSVAMTIVRDAGGGWRAATIEAYEDPYCE
jgi:hypothetical protein